MYWFHDQWIQEESRRFKEGDLVGDPELALKAFRTLLFLTPEGQKQIPHLSQGELIELMFVTFAEELAYQRHQVFVRWEQDVFPLLQQRRDALRDLLESQGYRTSLRGDEIVIVDKPKHASFDFGISINMDPARRRDISEDSIQRISQFYLKARNPKHATCFFEHESIDFKSEKRKYEKHPRVLKELQEKINMLTEFRNHWQSQNESRYWSVMNQKPSVLMRPYVHYPNDLIPTPPIRIKYWISPKHFQIADLIEIYPTGKLYSVQAVPHLVVKLIQSGNIVEFTVGKYPFEILM